MMIRDLPADLISMKLGINVQGQSSLGGRTLRPAVIGLVRIIREEHPTTPIAVISPIACPNREVKANAVGMTLSAIREQIADAVGRFVACGDRHIVYVDGRKLFDEELAQRYLPDGLHPNGDGYEIIGRNFAPVVLDELARLGLLGQVGP